jgi:hypothetical protein
MPNFAPSLAHTRAHSDNEQRLPMWVVYRPITKDHPGKWLARMHLTLPEHEITDHLIFGETLAEVRAKLPFGLSNIGRMLEDDLVIEEVWV